MNSMILEFGISHVIDKWVCVMFNFHPRTMHVFKDNAIDDNNNVIRSIYQILIIDDIGLKWMVNVEKFMIVAKNLSKSLQNIILMPKAMAFIVKALSML